MHAESYASHLVRCSSSILLYVLWLQELMPEEKGYGVYGISAILHMHLHAHRRNIQINHRGACTHIANKKDVCVSIRSFVRVLCYRRRTAATVVECTKRKYALKNVFE